LSDLHNVAASWRAFTSLKPCVAIWRYPELLWLRPGSRPTGKHGVSVYLLVVLHFANRGHGDAEASP
jgi:hypothetical protein